MVNWNNLTLPREFFLGHDETRVTLLPNAVLSPARHGAQPESQPVRLLAIPGMSTTIMLQLVGGPHQRKLTIRMHWFWGNV